MDLDAEQIFAFPVSHAQERLWFMAQLSPEAPMFNLNNAVRLEGVPDIALLEAALAEITGRHEALRTCFRVLDGRTTQLVRPASFVHARSLSLANGDERELARLLREEGAAPFDTAAGPLFRLAVIPLPAREYVLSLTMHHLISDAWSLGLFWHELSALSRAFAQGEPSPLPPLPIQYGDFAVWQRERLAAGAYAEQTTYWKRRLAGLAALELPTDRPRPPVQTFTGRRHALRLDAALTSALRALAAESGATPFMVLLAAFQVLLGRWSQQDDVAVGTYVAGRGPPEVERLIGLFLNTVVLRSDLSAAPTYRGFLDQVRAMTLDAYANQDVPFATVVQELRPQRNLSRNPLFQVVFQLINVPTLDGRGRDSRPLLEVELGSSLFDLTCTLWETPDEIHGHLEYNSDLFDAATIERLAGHFDTLLRSIVADPDARVTSLALMRPGERRRLVHELNGTERPPAAGDGIAARFAAQASATPDAPAFRSDGVAASFAQLDKQVEALARRLAAAGARPGVRVGVCLPRGLDSAAALLAVLRCGAVYVPLNPAEGAARLAFVARDAELGAVIADEPVPGVELVHPAGAPAPARAWPAPPALSDVAAILYTSGSTGRPKGAAVCHGEILSRLDWMWREYPFAPGDVGCHRTAISFVDSLWELLGPLLAGFPTVIVPERVAADPEAFVRVLADAGVTRIWLVPSLLRALLLAFDDLAERLPALCFWVTSGEALSIDLYDAFVRRMPHATLYNLYGTSEVWDATWWDPSSAPPPNGRVPIGRPIDNMAAYVLERSLEPCPTGVPGELHVGGVGVSQGYPGRPGLTAERFIPDPFASRPGERLFRTRDRARVLSSGDIEILGRLDHQVKVRGLLVDLGDVEEALERCPGVLEAAVVAIEPSVETALAAHVVAAPGVPAAELRRRLHEQLPDHMVPQAFRFHDELPLTSAGKLDREAMARAPTPAGARRPATGRDAPAGAVERLLFDIWRDVLETDDFGVTDNFFDLGGHSLLLFRVVSQLNQAWAAPVPMNDLFRHPTISSLARRLEQAGAGDATTPGAAQFARGGTP
jgi:amino acid adenylation domain-containing protein